MEDLIITAALNGAEVTRQQNPHLPITSLELAESAARCRAEGAAVVHVHARLPDGTPTQSPEIYAEIIQRIRERTDVVIQISSGGAVGMTAEERLAPVLLKPEMASLTAGTVNFGQGVFWNPPDLIAQFARTMVEQGVVPEIEAFDMGHIANALALVRQGVLTLPLHFNFVLGVPGGIEASVKNLLHMAEALPPNCTWSAAGIGRAQLPTAAAAILLGGHVRVGLEDNLYYARGVLATNEMLVQRAARLAKIMGRKIATPDDVRRIFRIGRRNS